MSQQSKVHFVYLGGSLPKYAHASIDLAKEFSGLDVVLITDSKKIRNLDKNRFEVIHLNDFYNPADFIETAKSRLFPARFREGFWLKTLERFFVLEQFMRSKKLNSIFHAELDQLLFSANHLISKLESQEHKGLFFPYHTTLEPIASIFYTNDSDSLTSLINYAKTNFQYKSDMQLLGLWAKEYPNRAFIMPTIATEKLKSDFALETKSRILTNLDLDGVVDGAQLGQWVAGIDPRNVPILQRPLNHHVDKLEPLLLSQTDLEQTHLAFDTSSGFLEVQYGDRKSNNLYNLHLHSKIHSWLASKKNPINEIVDLANSKYPVAISGTKRIQVIDFVTRKVELIRKRPLHVLIQISSWLISRINSKFNRRPSSKPFLSGDSFRKISDFVFENQSNTFDSSQLINGSIIFCESNLLEDLISKLSSCNFVFRIILGNSDRNFDIDETDLLNSKNFQAVFAQNLINQISGTYSLPIGLENSWRFKHGIALTFKLLRLFRFERKFRIMWSFRPTNVLERIKAATILSCCESADYLGDINVFSHQLSLSKYAFVASPPGNGLDTHRTWEAMYLRCVPIVKRSFMTEEYERLGLPIWIVDSYDELIGLTEDFLENRYKELEPRFDSEALWFDFWENKIRSSF